MKNPQILNIPAKVSVHLPDYLILKNIYIFMY